MSSRKSKQKSGILVNSWKQWKQSTKGSTTTTTLFYLPLANFQQMCYTRSSFTASQLITMHLWNLQSPLSYSHKYAAHRAEWFDWHVKMLCASDWGHSTFWESAPYDTLMTTTLFFIRRKALLDQGKNLSALRQGGIPIKIRYLGSNFFSCQVLGDLSTYVIRHIAIYGNMASSPLILSTSSW